MNKFIKYGTIFGCILVLGGAGVATAAFALGAEPVNIAALFDKKFSSHYDTYYGYHNNPPYEAIEQTSVYISEETLPASTYIEESNTYSETQVTLEHAGSTYENGETVVYGGSGNPDGYAHSYSDVTDLEIMIEGGYVETYVDANLDELLVISDNESGNNIRFSDTERYQKLEVRVQEGDSCRIGIPAEWKLNSLEVESAGGRFTGEVPEIQEAEFTTHGGEISVLQNEGRYTDIECVNGFINWSGSGEKTRTIDVECTTNGTVEVDLIDYPEPEHIGYDVEYNNGTVEFYGTVWEGDGNNGRKSENGMAHLELEAEAGGTIIIH